MTCAIAKWDLIGKTDTTKLTEIHISIKIGPRNVIHTCSFVTKLSVRIKGTLYHSPFGLSVT